VAQRAEFRRSARNAEEFDQESGVDLSARIVCNRVDSSAIPIVERDVGVCLDDGFNCRGGGFSSAAGSWHEFPLRDQRPELIQLDQLGFDLDLLDSAAQVCRGVVGCRRRAGLEPFPYRTQRPDDLAMPGVHSGSGRLEIGRGQPLASLGTDERCEQDEIDVQTVSVLQVQARIGHAVARVERQGESLDGPMLLCGVGSAVGL
jgi:hypothetical protein